MFILYCSIWLKRGQHRYITVLKRIRRNVFKLFQVSSKINSVVKTYLKVFTKLPCRSWKS